MKRIALTLLSVAGAVAGLMAIPGPVPASAAATSSVTCAMPFVFQEAAPDNLGGHMWAHPDAPHTVYAIPHDARQFTKWCLEPETHVGKWRQIEQYGTSRCMRLQGRNRTVEEGSCSGSASKWHFIGFAVSNHDTAVEIQSQFNKACIWQTSVGARVTYKPCNSHTRADKWLDGTAS